MRSLVLSCGLVLAVALLGCPKRTPTEVAGSDDEQMDQYAAKLDELKARTQASEPPCKEWCSMAKTVCQVSKGSCEVSARNAERQDMQKRCITSQEDCVTFNDRCAGCDH